MTTYDEYVRLVRRHEDGSYNLADVYLLHRHFGGIPPNVGDYITLIADDGWYYVTEIVEKHRIQEFEADNEYWCLVIRDVEDSSDFENLTQCLKNASREFENVQRKRQAALF